MAGEDLAVEAAAAPKGCDGAAAPAAGAPKAPKAGAGDALVEAVEDAAPNAPNEEANPGAAGVPNAPKAGAAPVDGAGAKVLAPNAPKGKVDAALEAAAVPATAALPEVAGSEAPKAAAAPKPPKDMAVCELLDPPNAPAPIDVNGKEAAVEEAGALPKAPKDDVAASGFDAAAGIAAPKAPNDEVAVADCGAVANAAAPKAPNVEDAAAGFDAAAEVAAPNREVVLEPAFPSPPAWFSSVTVLGNVWAGDGAPGASVLLLGPAPDPRLRPIRDAAPSVASAVPTPTLGSRDSPAAGFEAGTPPGGPAVLPGGPAGFVPVTLARSSFAPATCQEGKQERLASHSMRRKGGHSVQRARLSVRQACTPEGYPATPPEPCWGVGVGPLPPA